MERVSLKEGVKVKIRKKGGSLCSQLERTGGELAAGLLFRTPLT